MKKSGGLFQHTARDKRLTDTTTTRSNTLAAPSSRFDEAYYRRHYESPRTQAETPQETALRGDFIAAYLRHIDLPVRRIVDLGCGTGRLLNVLKEHFPKAKLTGVEFSEFACAQYGWQRGSVVDYRPRTPYDLVVCNDVIQYLPEADAERALSNLAKICRGALYLGVLTQEDWENGCDQSRTDGNVHLRASAWYRERLAKHFVNAGGGIFVRHETPVLLWSLEYLS